MLPRRKSPTEKWQLLRFQSKPNIKKRTSKEKIFLLKMLRSVTFILLASLQLAFGQSGCLGASEFIIVDLVLDFDNATLECDLLGGELAVPFNRAEHEFIMDLLAPFPPLANFWLGKKIS